MIVADRYEGTYEKSIDKAEQISSTNSGEDWRSGQGERRDDERELNTWSTNFKYTGSLSILISFPAFLSPSSLAAIQIKCNQIK